jgi:phosphate uptake regulator
VLFSGRRGSAMSHLETNEERRKVQFTGGSTYIVSLPKTWIAQNQLKRGSYIKIRQEEGGILLIDPVESKIPEKKVAAASIMITPRDSPEAVTRKTVSAYLAGYTLILMKAKELKITPKQRHDIKALVRRMLVGTEIVTDSPTELALQVLLSYPGLTIQSAIRRMSIITTSMHKDALKALKTRDETLAKDVLSNDNEVDRFYLYVVRHLRSTALNPKINKICITKEKFSLGYYLVTKSIERTADHAVKIAENSLSLKHELKNELTRDIENMSIIATSMFETAVESLFRQDYNLAETILERIQEFMVLERKAVSTAQMDGEDAATLRLIIESIRRTAEYASDIAETVLNLTVESILA